MVIKPNSDYLTRMVRRMPPKDCGVLPGTVPVVAFGDTRTAAVATLGINPSRVEFMAANRFLTGAERRLPTLESLGADDPSSLSDRQVSAVVDGCARYFSVNPYRGWFDRFDKVISAGLGVSYYKGTACHLDLVQWATDPIWSGLDARQRLALLEDGAPHLKAQLESEAIELVVVNGAQVWEQLRRSGLVIADEVGEIRYGAHQSSKLRVGTGCGARFVGWTLNLQSSHGVTQSTHESLAEWLTSVSQHPSRPLLIDDHLGRTTIDSKHGFAALLRRWFDSSDAETIGDVSRFGGKPLVHVDLGGRLVVLNADTKRSAVAKYLATVEAVGADSPWRVMRNANGIANKVEFTRSGPATPGWYCYLRQPLDSEGDI